jgi:membrane protein
MPDASSDRPELTLNFMWRLLRETFDEWLADKAPRLGAALAFYSVLSIGPLLLIVVSVAGLAFGEDSVRLQLVTEIRNLIGDTGAQAIETIMTNSHNREAGIVATLIGFATLIISATGFFAQLQDALNAIWNVESKENDHWTWFLKKRVLSFALIVGIGFLLLISLVVSAALAAFGGMFANVLPAFMLHSFNLAVSFAVTTFLFAMTFKMLPDAHIEWRDVWIGAAITALLFSVGKFFIGIYLGQSALSSTYGAAGSLIVVLVWIYYSTQIFFFGAEFTQVYSRYFGSHITAKHRRVKTPKTPEM